MKLIFALGNPGPEYQKTRHNIGWMILDELAKDRGAEFKLSKKLKSEIAEFSSGGEKILLAKPTTYYNETGQAARAIADFYKISSEDILVVHDDLALDFGKIRIRESGSDAGNKGIKSLNRHIGENFPRIKIGTKNALAELQSSPDFVLSNFSASEMKSLKENITPKAIEIIDNFVYGELEITSLQII